MELDKILAGDPGFEIGCTDGHLPTDTERVVEQQLPNLATDAKLWKSFIDALVRLSERRDKGWLVMYYLIDIVYWEKKHHQTLLAASTLKSIGQNLLMHTEAWSIDTAWSGYQFQDGLWGDVRRLSKILQLKHGIKLFDEDLS